MAKAARSNQRRRIGWDPWQALKAREHIVLGWMELPSVVGGAVYWPRGERAAVVLDKGLDRIGRLEALAHELVHDEQGGVCEHDHMPETWDAVVERVEERVRDEAARRLVPLDLLAAHKAVAEANDISVMPLDVADLFDVSVETATRAMRLLGATHAIE